MRSTMRSFLVVIAVLVLQACASTPKATANYDRSVDFSAYRTFAFFEKLGTDAAGYQSLVTQTLKASARREMESRGYTYTDTGADLLLNFNARLSEKTDIDQVPVAAPMYMGYRRGLYGGWAGYDIMALQDPDIRARNLLGPKEYGSITAPTMVVWTSDDPTADVAEGRRIASMIPGARFEVMPGCGHWPQYEDPKTFNRLHLDFLLGRA